MKLLPPNSDIQGVWPVQISGPEWQAGGVPDPEMESRGGWEDTVAVGGVCHGVAVDVANPADTRGVQEEHVWFSGGERTETGEYPCRRGVGTNRGGGEEYGVSEQKREEKGREEDGVFFFSFLFSFRQSVQFSLVQFSSVQFSPVSSVRSVSQSSQSSRRSVGQSVSQSPGEVVGRTSHANHSWITLFQPHPGHGGGGVSDQAI